MTVLKVELSPYLLKLVELVSKSMGSSRTAALESMLYRVELMSKHGKLNEAFGLDWIDAAAELQAAGLGATPKDAVSVLGEEIPFDVKLLETSGQSKSGFAGVSTTGSGFRALVPDPEKGGSRYLPSRAMAVQAAIDRFKWYEQHGMLYGALGRAIRERQRSSPHETLLENLEWARTMVNKSKHDFTSDQVEAMIKRQREIKGMPSEWEHNLGPEPTAPEEPAFVEPAEDEACAVCEKPIRATDRFTFLGKTEKAVHTHCLDHLGRPRPKNQTATP